MILRSLGLALAVAALSIRSTTATDSVQVTVRYTIVPVCKFFGATVPAMNLSNTGPGGDIDPRLSTPATGSVQIGYRCTSGTAPTFGVPSAATLSCATCAGTPTMDAALTWTADGAGLGMGDGGNRVFSLTGQVAAGAYQAAAPGAYLGSVTVTVSP
jgi:hypothetical protein